MSLKKSKVFVSMQWDTEFAATVDTHTKRLGIARTRLIEALIEGLTEEQMDAAVEIGKKVIDEKRAAYLKNRKELRGRLELLSPDKLNALLDSVDAKS
jgi:hypothetical protein